MHDLVLCGEGVKWDFTSSVVEVLAGRWSLLLRVHLVNTLVVVFDLLQCLFLFILCLLDHYDFLFCLIDLLLALPVCDCLPELYTLRVRDGRCSRANTCVPCVDARHGSWVCLEVLQPASALHPLLRLHFPGVNVLRHDVVNVCVGQ